MSAYETNNITLIGRLTKDPEGKTANNGKFVTKMYIANTPMAEDKGTLFINVSVWGTQGENAAKFLKKGDQCAVVGKLTMRNWESNDGQKHTAYDIIANSVQYLQKKKGNENAAPAQTNSAPAQNTDDGDMPF